MDDNREAPVRLDFFRLVRRLNDCLAKISPEACLDEDVHEAWAGYFQELKITEDEVEQLGTWYVQHYTVPPSIPMLTYYVNCLREHGHLPAHRIISSTERHAVAILQATAGLNLDRHTLADALFQAAALVHNAALLEDVPDLPPEQVRNEVEVRARLANYFSTDILREVKSGVGFSAPVRKTLFPYS